MIIRIPPDFHDFMSARMTQTQKVIIGIALGVTLGSLLLLTLAVLALLSTK